MEDVKSKKVCASTKSGKSDDDSNNEKNDPEEIEIEPRKILTYDIWRMVFKYLNGKDMCIGSAVCRMWKDAFEKEMALHGPFYLSTRLEDLALIEGRKIANDLRTKPRTVLCCSESLDGNSAFQQEKDCICKNLPTTCDIVYMYTYDVVMRVKSKLEKQPSPEFKTACTFFPHLPHAQMKLYYLKHSRKTQASEMMKHARKMGAELSHKAGEKSKCVITFCNAAYSKYIRTMLNSISYKRDKQQTLALIGGQTEYLYVCEKGEKTACRVKVSWAAITLSKSGLQSWSVLVKRNCREKEQIEGKLRELKEAIKLKRHSAGLMFGCCARIDNKNVEVEAFKNVFPDVPLMCCYGDGEFGIDTLHDEPDSKGRLLVHQYSTIYLIITYP